MSVNIATTFGALLLGGLYASLLSGMVAIQVIIYFKTYQGDRTRIKVLVLVVWILDAMHTGLMWGGLWDMLIGNFGQAEHIDFLPWAISSTVAVTGVLTFLVHCFFSHRIFMLSRRNWFLVVPILLIALARIASASLTTAELILLKSLTEFKKHFHWNFTLGLALSSVVDILITGSLFFLLKTSRTTDFNLNAVIDSLILYAFETGSLTTAGTIVAMICWLVMPYNLIFMGLHLVIAKFYANSLLVTLNTRRNLRRARSSTTHHGSREHPIQFPIPDSRRASHYPLSSKDFPNIRSPKVTISIERSVHCEET